MLGSVRYFWTLGAAKGAKMAEKLPYSKPELKVLGTIQELTQTGQSMAGGDAKTGSVLSQGQ